MEINGVKFDVIKKNGKAWVRMNAFGHTTDMMIYKVNTDQPYIRYAGMYIPLTEQMKAEI